jgi:beta-lactamase superfamily II metal-dependent hydrolase
MKITAFHAADGDCCLIESRKAPKHRILVDGGRKASYEGNVRDVLGGLRTDGVKLDLVCVSHIDDDHISGVLRLIEDEVAWRKFEFLKQSKPSTKPPKIARPPKIGEVWHNGLFRLVGDETGHAVQPVLSTMATILAGSENDDIREVASDLDDLVNGELSSMELTRRLSTEQLGIALNPRSSGRLLKRSSSGPLKKSESVAFGSLGVRLLGPSQDDIDNLREKWQAFLKKSKIALEDLHADMLEDEKRLGALSPRIVANPILDQSLGQGLSKVTEANLASVMLLVEEGGATALMTGDGVSSEIIEGLKRHKKLDAAGRIHVNLLKVQHHGATANVDEAFVRTATADNYLFCGNGAHTNPELEVVEAFAAARLRGFDGGGPIGPARPFKFWFTSSPATPDTTKKQTRKKHMTAVRDLVKKLRKGHTTKMQAATFLKSGHFTIEL